MQPPARCSNHRCVYIEQCDLGAHNICFNIKVTKLVNNSALLFRGLMITLKCFQKDQKNKIACADMDQIALYGAI